MVDHKRMDRLTELVERSGAKLIAVGDGKQLPSIGPGGMFDRLALHAPTAELADVHRTSDPAERKAWAALRAGEPERAMAHYRAQGRLHFADTRDQAGERAVQRWAQLLDHHDIRQVALIADASNVEIDRLNARAQHLRAERGELGPDELPLPDRHYGLREGDLIAFTAQHRPPGAATGRERRPRPGHRHPLERRLPDRRARRLRARATARRRGPRLLRLAYAQHVYRQQGATVERSSSSPAAGRPARRPPTSRPARARHGTDWFLARDELGHEGQDEQRVELLAEKMRTSRVQLPSLSLSDITDTQWEPADQHLRLLGRERMMSPFSRGLARRPEVGRGRDP